MARYLPAALTALGTLTTAVAGAAARPGTAPDDPASGGGGPPGFVTDLLGDVLPSFVLDLLGSLPVPEFLQGLVALPL